MKKSNKIIIIGFFIQLTTMAFGRFAYTLILPDMMKSLGFSNTTMGILGTGIVIGYLLNAFLSGRLANIIGAELTINISIFLTSLSLFSLGFFSNFSILFISTVILGMGASGCYISIISLINHYHKEKGKAFGIVMGGSGIGIMMCGYIIPPLLALSKTNGYRISWYALSIINFLVLINALIFLRPDKSFIKDMKNNNKGKSVINTFKGNTPLIITITIYFLVGFSYIIYATYFGPYSINEMGFSAKRTGMMWSFFGINTVYSGIIWGILSDKFNKVNMALISILFLAFSVFIIIPFKIEILFYVSTFIFGFSFMGFTTINASLISDEVNKNEMSKVFGTSTFIHGSGQVIGTSLSGYLKDITNTFKVPLSISFFVFLICLFLFFLLKKSIYKNKRQS